MLSHDFPLRFEKLRRKTSAIFPSSLSFFFSCSFCIQEEEEREGESRHPSMHQGGVLGRYWTALGYVTPRGQAETPARQHIRHPYRKTFV